MFPGVEKVKWANLYIKLIVSKAHSCLLSCLPSPHKGTHGNSSPLHNSILHGGAVILKADEGYNQNQLWAFIKQRIL